MADAREGQIRIARRLRTARELAGLSQGQVARLLGWHRPTVTEIEAGRRKVSGDELARFAGLYEVSIDWLVGESFTPDEVVDDKIALAARELGKLKPEDFDRLMRLLKSLREGSDH